MVTHLTQETDVVVVFSYTEESSRQDVVTGQYKCLVTTRTLSFVSCGHLLLLSFLGYIVKPFVVLPTPEKKVFFKTVLRAVQAGGATVVVVRCLDDGMAPITTTRLHGTSSIVKDLTSSILPREKRPLLSLSTGSLKGAATQNTRCSMSQRVDTICPR